MNCDYFIIHSEKPKLHLSSPSTTQPTPPTHRFTTRPKNPHRTIQRSEFPSSPEQRSAYPTLRLTCFLPLLWSRKDLSLRYVNIALRLLVVVLVLWHKALNDNAYTQLTRRRLMTVVIPQ